MEGEVKPEYMNSEQLKQLRERSRRLFGSAKFVRQLRKIEEVGTPKLKMHHIGCGGEFIDGKCDKCSITLLEIWESCGYRVPNDANREQITGNLAKSINTHFEKSMVEFFSYDNNNTDKLVGSLGSIAMRDPGTNKFVKIGTTTRFEPLLLNKELQVIKVVRSDEELCGYEISGLPSEAKIEYFGIMPEVPNQTQKFFLIYHPDRNKYDYNFKCGIGYLNGFMFDYQITDVSRARDGGTTVIDLVGGCRFIFPSPFDVTGNVATYNTLPIKLFDIGKSDHADNWLESQTNKMQMKLNIKQQSRIKALLRNIEYLTTKAVATGGSWNFEIDSDGKGKEVIKAILTNGKNHPVLDFQVGDYVKYNGPAVAAGRIISYNECHKVYRVKGMNFNGDFSPSNLIKITKEEADEIVYGKVA